MHALHFPQEGDVLVSNHPQLAGGSHLPDITVVTPVFNAGSIVFFVASRGHHAGAGAGGAQRVQGCGAVLEPLREGLRPSGAGGAARSTPWGSSSLPPPHREYYMKL